MRRTILGLFVDPANSEPESFHADDESFQVEDVQEDLGGMTVYHGTAASLGYEEREAPLIHEDGEIETADQTFETAKATEWFAVPDANPGFMAIDSSDGEFAFNQLTRSTGGWVQRAVYSLDALTQHLESQDAAFWQVGWSDNREAGTWYPGDGSDESITQKGLREKKNQIGFEYRNETHIRGTCAGSGYLELYSPEGWAWEAMAQYIRDEVLEFSGVMDVGSADEIADGTADFDRESCEECGRETDLEETADGTLCVVCADKVEEENSPNTTLDDHEAAATDGGCDE